MNITSNTSTEVTVSIALPSDIPPPKFVIGQLVQGSKHGSKAICGRLVGMNYVSPAAAEALEIEPGWEYTIEGLTSTAIKTYVHPDLKRLLTALAELKGCSVSDCLNEAIQTWLQLPEQQELRVDWHNSHPDFTYDLNEVTYNFDEEDLKLLTHLEIDVQLLEEG